MCDFLCTVPVVQSAIDTLMSQALLVTGVVKSQGLYLMQNMLSCWIGSDAGLQQETLVTSRRGL